MAMVTQLTGRDYDELPKYLQDGLTVTTNSQPVISALDPVFTYFHQIWSSQGLPTGYGHLQ